MSRTRGRRERTATESLLAIVLGLEAFLVFFVALTLYGLDLAPASLALGGGVAAILLLVLLASRIRFAWARWLGWVLQAGLIALGVLTPVMFGVGAVFAGIWTFCAIKGGQLDRAKAELLAAHPDATPSTPNER